MPYSTITLEEHYLSNAIKQAGGDVTKRYEGSPASIQDRLKDLSKDGIRLQEMDKGHVSLQVISHAPGVTSCEPSVIAKANDELAEAVNGAPQGRLAGFAALPMEHPQKAVAELERCVKSLGFVGALIDSHLARGKGADLYYDGEHFWPVFAKAEELDVPIYIHPTFATENMMDLLYKGNYSDQTALQLSSAGFGWHEDTGLHVLRLYAAGLFDKFLKLKIVIGHMGELIPYQLERIDGMAPTWNSNTKRSFKDVWDTNIYVTTSGMFSLNPMACLIRNTKIDHILYSVDWPFAMNDKGVGFLQELETSGMLKPEEVNMIAYGNAEKLLKVEAQGGRKTG